MGGEVRSNHERRGRRIQRLERLVCDEEHEGFARLAELEQRVAMVDGLLARLDGVEAEVRLAMGMSSDALTHTASLLESVDELDETGQRMALGLRTIAAAFADMTGCVVTADPRTTRTG